MPDLEKYLQRIGYSGPLEPNLQTLTAVHRAHLISIPYENLDIHLGRKLGLELDHIFEKIVVQKRGGWCYEQNSLLAWALRELGFGVDYLSGAVPKASAGLNADGNHLVLLVHLPSQRETQSMELFIADAGFGDGFLEPIPLREGRYIQGGFEFALKPQADGRWLMHNHAHGSAPTYDFGLQTYGLEHFQSKCEWLQTSPESGFVRTTVCQRLTLNSILTLRGLIFSTVTPQGVQKHTIESEAEYRRVLSEMFGLELPEVRPLYAKVWQRHVEWLEAESAASVQ